MSAILSILSPASSFATGTPTPPTPAHHTTEVISATAPTTSGTGPATTSYNTSPALSPESLNRLGSTLTKYIVIGIIVLLVFLLLGGVSWWWKRRKRRERFGLDDDEQGVYGWSRRGSEPSRRGSESSAVMLGKAGKGKWSGSEETLRGEEAAKEAPAAPAA